MAAAAIIDIYFPSVGGDCIFFLLLFLLLLYPSPPPPLFLSSLHIFLLPIHSFYYINTPYEHVHTLLLDSLCKIVFPFHVLSLFNPSFFHHLSSPSFSSSPLSHFFALSISPPSFQISQPPIFSGVLISWLVCECHFPLYFIEWSYG